MAQNLNIVYNFAVKLCLLREDLAQKLLKSTPQLNLAGSGRAELLAAYTKLFLRWNNFVRFRRDLRQPLRLPRRDWQRPIGTQADDVLVALLPDERFLALLVLGQGFSLKDVSQVMGYNKNLLAQTFNAVLKKLLMV